ncbi:MAG: peptidase U34 [Alphaproteobacteria bacterium]|nr:peptidase U34 [Alphaproteobacteria bacterium]MBU1515770.1 peptidase U34 [Alphaproteobacteria bacterium]MBU2097053.1 peptidase U34 [Alphaproteobacteria bacterium]MBU2149569.1 peptidase U34 [Alphaproteobacteria bacterium]MBU2308955.1 peptidase U34 [Alphaproteobacteria bacterium]
MCDTLASLASSTARGAVLFAKNSDRERNEAQVLELSPARANPPGTPLRLTYITIPDAPHTYACLLSRPFWMWGAEMGANDQGVVVGNEALHARTPAQRKRALIGMDLVRLGVERGGTAREALDVIVDLLERHGQGGDCGHLGRFFYNNGFIIADPTEAYVLETAGRSWVWEKVASHRALSNAYSIGAGHDGISPDLARPERYDVAASLIDEARDAISFGRGRCARGQALLDAAAPNLTPAAMMSILRDHGDDPAWTPANTSTRTLCMHASHGPRRSQSVASMVSELAPGRTVHWVTGTSAPCTGLFKPFVFGAATPPFGPAPTDQADAASRWWRHERLHRAMLADFTPALAAIAPERDALEARFRARMDAAFAAGDLDAAIARCWAEADAAEARWLAALPPPVTREPAGHLASWARLNHVAGLRP